MKKRSNADLTDILNVAKTYISHQESINLITKAYYYAEKKHEGQFRKSGEPYVIHVNEVAYILATLHVGPKTIVAGLLHDVLEDTDTTREQMIADFDEEITTLVEGVTKIGALKFKNEKEYMAENHRKIFIAMAKDIRVILIKLVDRLHNMRTLQYQSPEKQKKISSETLEVYAPIAHRLGISEIKNELEDLCFRYLNPEEYKHIAKLVEDKKIERDAQVKTMIENISNLLTDNHIEFRIFGRSKHLYSIHKKMVQKNKRFDEILDLLAIRIVTKTELNCYEILGYIHATYRPIPGRLKDYIAVPKVNMYQSLHTTIVGEEGKIFEVQIRTEEMDAIAEQGVAAHWRYKEGSKYNAQAEQKEIEEKLSWFRDLFTITTDSDDAQGYMETLQRDLFEANVYVMTPNGKVIDLPNGSTPIDFAYRIHTEVGHSTVGALVNDVLVPLNTPLKTGDVVKIRTSKQFAGPSEDWLKIVKTNGAKNKIRSYLTKKDLEEKQAQTERGEQLLKEELRKRQLEIDDYMDPKKLETIFGQCSVSNYTDFMYAIAIKSLSTQSVVEKLVNQRKTNILDNDSVNKIYVNKETRKLPSKSGIYVKGIDSMLIHIASCCSPIPGDDIVGYISKGMGVKVHRVDCPNIIKEKKRLIEVEWDENREPRKYIVNLHILANDRNFLLTDLITVAAQYKASLQAVNSYVNEEDLTAVIKLAVLVEDGVHLRNVIANLKKVNSVISVEREIK